MIRNLWYEFIFVGWRIKAWKQRKAVGIDRKRYTRVYDYRHREDVGKVAYKTIMSPWKFPFIYVTVRKGEEYRKFRQLSAGKHLFAWQWRLMDRLKQRD